jgi:hypothetical protein
MDEDTTAVWSRGDVVYAAYLAVIALAWIVAPVVAVLATG